MLALLLALALGLAMPVSAVPGPKPPTGAEDELSARFLAAIKTHRVAVPDDRLGRRLLAEYGALYVCKAAGVSFPEVMRFADQPALTRFQTAAHPTAVKLGRTVIELQPPAAQALEEALSDAKREHLTISARGGPSAARRSMSEATGFWKKRVENALAHWTKAGKLTPARAAAIRAMPLAEQIEAALEEEDQGHFFALSLDKTVLRSTAPPGSSQHHAMLALDVEEHESAKVRALLARHGWFQTVVSDLPHFTYLGAAESELAGLGLGRVEAESRTWWLPARR